jgi:phage tail protein X
MTLYTTATTERLDLICWRYYGHLRGTVEAVLDLPANTHLRHLDIARLPLGTTLILPPEPPRAAPKPRRF